MKFSFSIDSFLYFSIGFFSQLFQILIFREVLLITSGNEFSIGLVFFIWFIFGSLGSYAGKLLPSSSLFYFYSAYPLVFSVSLILLKTNRLFINPGAGQQVNLWSMLWFSCLTLGMVAFSGGLCLILGYRYFRTDGFVAAYFFDSLGHFASGLVFTYVLIVNFSSSVIYLTVLSLFAIAHFIFSLIHRKKGYLLVSFLILFLSVSSSRVSDVLIRKNWKLFNAAFELKAFTDTQYNNLALLEYGGIYNLYANGNLSLTFPEDITIQSEIWTSLCQTPCTGKKSVALIGAGCTDLLYHYSKSIPDIHLVNIEIDRKKIEFTNKYYPRHGELSTRKNIEYIFEDGRKFLQNTERKFDILSLHTGDPSTLLVNRYYTREFFDTIKSALNSGGIFTFSLSSSENYQGRYMADLNGSIYQALKNSFRHIVVSPGDTNLFFASDSPYLTDEAQVLSERYAAMNLPDNPFFSPYQFQMIFPKWKKGKVIESLEKEIGHLSENRDFKPNSISFSLLNWFDMLNQGFRRFVVTLDFFYQGFFYLILPLLVLISLNRGTIKKFHKAESFCSIFFLSFSGITFYLLAIFVYQLHFGTLYSDIGALTAAFMLGLIVSIKAFSRSENLTCIYLLAILTCLLLLGCHLVPGLASSKTLILTIIILSGVLIGGGFSTINRLNPEDYLWIYCGDLIGSALCSLGTLPFLMPSAGFVKLVSILACYFLISLIRMFFKKRKKHGIIQEETDV